MSQLQVTGEAKIRSLEGVLTGTSGIVNALGINVANGIPKLDNDGKILVSQIPTLTGYIDGSGTANYLPRFTDSNTIGNSSIYQSGGVTYVTGYLSIDPFTPVSPLGIIQVGTKTTLNSTDAKILVNNLYTNTTPVNGHAFADNSALQKNDSIWAYASYDGRVEITGTGVTADHYVSFQAAPNYAFTGTMLDNFGTYTTHSISSGTITNNYGHYVANPVKTLSGIITNNYGIYIQNQNAGSTNYSIYSAGGFNYLAGPLQVIGSINADNVGGNIRFKGGGTDATDGGIYSSSGGNIFFANWEQTRGFVTNSNGKGYYFGGNFGVGTTSPNSILEITTTTPILTILASSSSAFHGIEFKQGAGLDAFIKQHPSTGEFRISNGRDSTWGGFITLYTDTVERINIGSGGVVKISNLAGTGTRAVLADSSGNLSAPISDISVKKNITSIGYGLSEILKMNPVWFDFVDDYKNYGEGRQNGSIAQEMAQIIPEAVFVTPSTGKMGINYDQLHAVYIKAIQELKAEIDQLKNK